MYQNDLKSFFPLCFRPRLCLFGHVWESHYEIKWKDEILFCNAAVAINQNSTASSCSARSIVLDYFVDRSKREHGEMTILPPGTTPPPPPLPILAHNGLSYRMEQDHRRTSNRSRSASGTSGLSGCVHQPHQSVVFDIDPKRTRCLIS